VTDLEIRVLGPIEVRRGGNPVALGGRTTLTLLAGLAVSPRRVVSVDALIDCIWDAEPPGNPRAALHNGVSRLRRILGHGSVETHGWGYRLHVDADDVDLLRFDEHLAAARRATALGLDKTAVAALDDAIHLWREPLLGNVDSPSLHREVVPRLTERYLEAVETWTELRLRLGIPGALEELAAVARAYPLREHLTGQLMIALVRAGRRADALVAYNTLRCALREELGIDPAAALQDLNVKIRRADPELDIAAPRHPQPAAGNAVASPGRGNGAAAFAPGGLVPPSGTWDRDAGGHPAAR
jgi:DNA-binding SARP family transcriptional activator